MPDDKLKDRMPTAPKPGDPDFTDNDHRIGRITMSASCLITESTRTISEEMSVVTSVMINSVRACADMKGDSFENIRRFCGDLSDRLKAMSQCLTPTEFHQAAKGEGSDVVPPRMM